MVPNVTSDTPDIRYLRDRKAYDRVRTQAVSYFLLHDDCNSSPLVMFQIGGSGWNAGKYVLHQRQGGPVLHFVRSAPETRDGILWLPSSLVSYYPTYKNTLTGRSERAPQLLRSTYAKIASTIKKQGHVVQFERVNGNWTHNWILPSAYDALRQGARLDVELLKELRVKGLEDFPGALPPPRKLRQMKTFRFRYTHDGSARQILASAPDQEQAKRMAEGQLRFRFGLVPDYTVEQVTC